MSDYGQRSPGTRNDPYCGYNFLVEIEGLIVGGFSEVSGLTIQVELETKTFGGENDCVFKFFKAVKYPDLVLKRGIGDADDLWNWYQNVIQGKIVRRNGSIYLLDQTRRKVRHWDFQNAYPIKWDGPALNAASATVALESLTLTLDRLVCS